MLCMYVTVYVKYANKLKKTSCIRMLLEKQRWKLENYGPSRGASGVVWLADCNDEVANHLIGCHLLKRPSVKKSLHYLQGLPYFISLKRV